MLCTQKSIKPIYNCIIVNLQGLKFINKTLRNQKRKRLISPENIGASRTQRKVNQSKRMKKLSSNKGLSFIKNLYYISLLMECQLTLKDVTIISTFYLDLIKFPSCLMPFFSGHLYRQFRYDILCLKAKMPPPTNLSASILQNIKVPYQTAYRCRGHKDKCRRTGEVSSKGLKEKCALFVSCHLLINSKECGGLKIRSTGGISLMRSVSLGDVNFTRKLQCTLIYCVFGVPLLAYSHSTIMLFFYGSLSSSLLVTLMGVSQLNCQRRINRFVGVCTALTELMEFYLIPHHLLYCINYGEIGGRKGWNAGIGRSEEGTQIEGQLYETSNRRKRNSLRVFRPTIFDFPSYNLSRYFTNAISVPPYSSPPAPVSPSSLLT
ncbi:hypothetical protein EGR_02035 [Echinococcus granulosus]|uniref:Uncharacterized protein n=1 Tax=Echinococcus granulosus TaxID=6210 RepID=W6URB5_ECHGR|nr:hypothetical protein EGR_02035 [Echinococcus granulosus]EUB63231.1 hypothetical protein EGR_02035 [Echinococcus granulosus]